jgi:uncharacterized membrane protein
MRAKCRAVVILFHLIIVNIFREEYKLWSSSLCSILKPPFVSSLFSQIFFLAPLSEMPSVYVVSLMSESKFHNHIEQQAKL